MTEDEKYVREQWEWVAYFEPDADCDIAMVQVANKKAQDIREFTSLQPLEAWSAAAEFTRTRLQQIRDVEQEIRRIVAVLNATDVSLRYEMIPWGDDEDDTTHINDIVDYVRDICAESRILAREQAALADLKRGLRVAEERTERK